MKVNNQEENKRRRVTFTSSLNEIFAEQLGKMVMVRGEGVVTPTGRPLSKVLPCPNQGGYGPYKGSQ
jgi:hypothetical protein